MSVVDRSLANRLKDDPPDRLLNFQTQVFQNLKRNFINCLRFQALRLLRTGRELPEVGPLTADAPVPTKPPAQTGNTTPEDCYHFRKQRLRSGARVSHFRLPRGCPGIITLGMKTGLEPRRPFIHFVTQEAMLRSSIRHHYSDVLVPGKYPC